jgi:hypothetical protein
MANHPTSLEKVEEMFATYAQKQVVEHVARTCNVSSGTVKKYVTKGDPNRGVEPFRLRLRRLTRLTARRVEKTVAYHKADGVAAAWQHLQILDDVIIDALLRYRDMLQTATPRLSEIAKAVELSHRLKSSLREWAEEDGGDGTGDIVLDKLSVTELEVYAETGVLPRSGGALRPEDQAAGEPVEAQAVIAAEEGPEPVDAEPAPGAPEPAAVPVEASPPPWLEPEE